MEHTGTSSVTDLCDRQIQYSNYPYYYYYYTAYIITHTQGYSILDKMFRLQHVA